MFNPNDQSQTFDGIYRGVVVDNADPDQNGRCRIRIYPMFEGVQDSHLPWAQYADGMFGGAGDNGGIFIPDVGAHVWCFFEAGDHRHPVFFAAAPASGDLPTESGTNYPQRKVFKTTAGIIIELDDTSGSVTIKVSHPSGTESETTNSGEVTLTVVDDYNIVVSGDCNITADGDVNVTGTTINLN